MRVDSPGLRYTDDFIEAEYEYQTTSVIEVGGNDGDGNNDTYTVRSGFYCC